MSRRSRKRKIIEVPNELVTEILLSLPVKSLLRFKSVCRDWNALIEEPEFISKHHKKGKNYFLVHTASRADTLMLHYRETPERLVAPEIDLAEDQFKGKQIFNLFRPDDGIFCVSFCNSGLLNLWNPATKELKTLPEPPQIKRLDPGVDEWIQWISSKGFGFDSKTNDYKVVIIHFPDFDVSYYRHPLDRVLFAQVYRMSRDSWREIDTSNVLLPTTFELLYYTKWEVHIDGAYFWLIHDRGRFKILSFDFGTEIFTTTWLPDGCNLFGNYFVDSDYFFVLNSRIAFLNPLSMDRSLDRLTKGGCEIWVLNEIGNEESWTKLYEFGPCSNIKLPLGSLKDDKLFAESESGDLVWCAPRDPTLPHWRDGIFTEKRAYEYKENLVKLNRKV